MENELLLRAPLFKDLNIQEIRDILNHLPHRLKKYKAGNLIAQSGETVDKLMIVTYGFVKGEMIDFAGKIIKIEDIQAPGALASAFIFGNKNRFPVNVLAITDTELLVVDKPDFLKLLKNNEKILINFLDIISNRSQFLSEKIKFLSFKTIKAKLAHLILQKAGKKENVVTFDMTQNDLADFFGVARPSVARALGELEDDGYLRADRKIITILDKNGLGKMTSD
jgi:CRP/FNR family transcriptional regulator, dissimilatory nitrate respiration regulator